MYSHKSHARRATLALALSWAALALPAPSPGVEETGARAPTADAGLAGDAVGVLREFCYRCHGREFKVEGYDVLDRAGLVKAREDADPYVTPGDPDASELWNRFDEMPPKGPKPSSEQKEVIRRWIVAGAPFPPEASKRAFVADLAVLSAIRDHLRGLDRADRPFARYFTLTALHNNPKVNAEELRLARAGVSKMVNSLSRKPEIVVPEVLGPSGTVLAVDLRRLGWDQDRVWSRLLAEYPYGLKYRNARDPLLRETAREVEDLVGESAGLPDLRADWFLDAAARPSLYHAILEIPANARTLETSLGVDVEADFLRNTLRRAGFTRSGVSKQMRLVDRHDSQLGYYWKSYDFRRTDAAVDLFRFPLGPAFPRNPFPDRAFTHAGGEMIFSLPNRLQGYMLADAEGVRIDEGPPDIVFDANDSAGGSVIINGLSCMGCHRNGMVDFRDRIREGVAVGGEPRVKVEALFARQDEWDRVLKRDQDRFLAALEEAVGPFLREGDPTAASAETRDLREPVVPVAKIYQADLDAGAVAAELNIDGAEALRTIVRANRRLQQLGLADLLTAGGAVNRANWATAGKGTSAYQEASSEIDRGLPALFFRPEE